MKHIKIEVVRSQYSTLYLEVPDDFECTVTNLRKQCEVDKIAEAQVKDDACWETEKTISIDSVDFCEEKEAVDYGCDSIADFVKTK